MSEEPPHTARFAEALADVENTREALEILHTRGLYPWSEGEPDAPQWWCPEWICDDCYRDYGGGGRWCAICNEIDENYRTAPDSLHTLRAVTDLGIARMRRVRDAVDTLHHGTRRVCPTCDGRGQVGPTEAACPTCGGARAVATIGARWAWRGMPLAAIQTLHNDRSEALGDPAAPFTAWTVPAMVAREAHLANLGNVAWSVLCPYDAPDDVRGAWPACRALALEGVHLLDATPTRVVLGVAE